MEQPEDLDGGVAAKPASVHDLAKLRRKARYLAQYDFDLSQELVRLQSGNELLTRLCRTMHEVLNVLVDFAIGENHKFNFCSLYALIMNQADSILEHVESRDKELTLGLFGKMSESSRKVLLKLLHKVRSEPDWVAQRISALTASELEALVPSSGSKSRQTNILHERPLDRNNIKKVQRGTILNTFLFTLFAPPGAFYAEDSLRLKLSATVVHNLISDSKTSSKGDKFCLSTFDAWSHLYGWTGAGRFEIILMDILQSGAKLMQQAEARDLAKTQETRNNYIISSKRDELEDEFFSIAVRDIFKLLSNDGAGGLPRGALMLSKAILDQVTDIDRRHYESFIIINWFFHHFLFTAITCPEVRHLDKVTTRFLIQCSKLG